MEVCVDLRAHAHQCILHVSDHVRGMGAARGASCVPLCASTSTCSPLAPVPAQQNTNHNTTTTQPQQYQQRYKLVTYSMAMCSVHVLPESLDSALMVALVGAPSEYVENNRLLQLGNSGRAVEIVVSQQKDYLGWHAHSSAPAPSDWQQLHEQSGGFWGACPACST
eukprot:scaffold51609_cov26-Tisochrysis_lutea.AAC.1